MTNHDDNTTSGYAISVADTTRTRLDPNDLGPKMPSVRVEFAESHATLPIVTAFEAGGASIAGVRCRFPVHGELPGGLRFTGWFDSFPGRGIGAVQFTLTNPHPADHPGGNWDLGNGGSREFASLSIKFATTPGSCRLSPEPGTPLTEVATPVTIHQESSGGTNWQSRAHIDQTGRVNLEYRGYRVTTPAGTTEGLRATPVLALGDLAIGVPEFWQNFPMALRCDGQYLTLDLLPLQAGRLHELQGGEQKTWQFRFGMDADPASLRSPLHCSAPPEWYCASGAIPHLTPESSDPHTDYIQLARQSIDGDDTFLRKRETLDEYGWRNYGDIYGDHEAVYHTGPTPLVSHDNNQYDCVLAFLQQYLRAGDTSYFDQAIACALHTVDIDSYHTLGDRAAYNGGLFWHTYHYADAGTGTHRSYPKSLRTGGHFESGRELSELGETGETLKKVLAIGGGPAGSHNYNAGLAMAYFLTGNTLFRDGAIGLANYVITADAPRGGVIGLLSRQYSGLATESSADYHGPGRASGNSLLALLTGHQLTSNEKYLDYANLVMHRVSHPLQNLDRLNLLNAELRWFYTMYLQALAEYLEYLADLGRASNESYAYGCGVLLHYAKWMATNERPILDTPDELQYPTETWAAQDMRKIEVFDRAAEHATDELRTLLQSRAREFHDYCAAKLQEFPTRSLCRPVVLAMRYGWSHLDFERNPDREMPVSGVKLRLGKYREFVSQKRLAVARAKKLIVAGGVMSVVAVAGLVWWVVRK